MATVTEPGHAANGRLAQFVASTVGKKLMMAATGLIMAGFLVVHATANLLAFAGPEHINAYSAFLHNVPELLWTARAVLLASVIVHAVSAFQLTRVSAQARPDAYDTRESQIATVASRTIRWFSILLALFIVIHLLHLTTGDLLPGFVEGNPYANLVTAFGGQRLMAAFYLVMMIVVGLHLYHGTWSAIRTLGLSRPRPNPFVRPVATVLAVALWLGFSAVPLGVLIGAIGPETAAATAAASGHQSPLQ
jgi:succinate dehydrogenase / fumarate reductase cytochrome b subunit